MFCSSLTLASSWSHVSLFYTLCGVLSIQSVTLNIHFLRGLPAWKQDCLMDNQRSNFYFFNFFIVDVLAFILFLVVFRRDLCTWACQSLCPDVMHDTHADVHGYLIYSMLFQLLIL